MFGGQSTSLPESSGNAAATGDEGGCEMSLTGKRELKCAFLRSLGEGGFAETAAHTSLSSPEIR